MAEIRRASVGDIGIIRGIAEVAFWDTYKPVLTVGQIDFMMEWMYSEESLLCQMVEKENVFYILSSEGSDVGYVSIERHKSPPADLDGFVVFNLQKIYLLPEFQGHGYGSLILEYAEEQMSSFAGSSCRGCYELNVNRSKKAGSFYQRHGLSINREGDFAIGNGYYMNDYIMRKML